MSNIERMSEAEVAELRAEHGWAKETIRAIESAVHANLSAPVEVGEAQRLAKALRDMSEIDFDNVFVPAADLVAKQVDEIAYLTRCLHDAEQQFLGSSSLVKQQAREIARLKAEVHDLNWAMGAPGFEQMADPEDQACSDAAHAATLERIAAMKARKERHERLVPEGVDVLDIVEQQAARLSRYGEVIKRAAEAMKSAISAMNRSEDIHALAVPDLEEALAELRSVESDALATTKGQQQ